MLIVADRRVQRKGGRRLKARLLDRKRLSLFPLMMDVFLQPVFVEALPNSQQKGAAYFIVLRPASLSLFFWPAHCLLQGAAWDKSVDMILKQHLPSSHLTGLFVVYVAGCGLG